MIFAQNFDMNINIVANYFCANPEQLGNMHMVTLEISPMIGRSDKNKCV